jgi:hypothetical protein
MAPLGAGVPFANNAVLAAVEVIVGELPAPVAPLPEGEGRWEVRVTAGERLEVWLAWWVRDVPPAGVDYHFTVQVLDDRGALQSQNDHAGFASDSWAAGDVVLSRFSLSLPQGTTAGRYRLRAGMYSYPDIVAVPAVNAEGEPIDDGATLAMLVVRNP